MVVRSHQRVKRADWLDQLADLSLACLGTAPHAQGDRLREFNDLLFLAPEKALVDGVKAIIPDRFDKWIDEGAYETAALAILDEAAYMISRGRGGYMATVMLSGGDECTVTADTFALAAVAAMAQGLLDSAQDLAPLSYLTELGAQPRHLH